MKLNHLCHVDWFHQQDVLAHLFPFSSLLAGRGRCTGRLSCSSVSSYLLSLSLLCPVSLLLLLLRAPGCVPSRPRLGDSDFPALTLFICKMCVTIVPSLTHLNEVETLGALGPSQSWPLPERTGFSPGTGPGACALGWRANRVALAQPTLALAQRSPPCSVRLYPTYNGKMCSRTFLSYSGLMGNPPLVPFLQE